MGTAVSKCWLPGGTAICRSPKATSVNWNVDQSRLSSNRSVMFTYWAGAVAVVKDDLLREDLARKSGDPREDLVVGAGETESTFLISDRDERRIASLLGWKAFGSVLSGGAGALAMIASILGRFGAGAGGWTFPWESLLN